MKFAKQLEQCMRQQWSEHYIQYKHLKKSLAALDRKRFKDARDISPSILGHLRLISDGFSIRTQHVPVELSEIEDETLSRINEDYLPCDAAWLSELEAQANNVRSFINSGLKALETQLAEIAVATQGETKVGERLALLESSPFATEVYPHQVDQKHMELRLLESIGRISQNSRRLREFEEINHVALYKILKKHDKTLSTDAGIEVALPNLLRSAGFNDESHFEALQVEMNKVQLKCMCVKGLKAPIEVAQLAAGLHPNIKNTSLGPRERQLWFFIGSSVALILPVLLLLNVPPKEPETYSDAQFLSSFPAFYFVFWVIFSLWCMGLVAYVCDSKHIDHKFLLGFDPDCAASPQSFFRYGACLLTVWITVFTLYICDYKWMMSPIFLEDGNVARSVQTYVGYPAVLLCILACCALCPSKGLPCRDKRAALRSLGRTMLAPFFKVSFGDNIMGDALTSLVKPLQDFPAAVCYFAASHPHTQAELQHFREAGHMCPEWEHDIVDPLLAALPLIFRALQCLRRFYDAPKATKHLLNFGKYLTSLAVVVVASTMDSKGVLCILLSGAATVYSASWDIKMDWALSPTLLMSSTPNGRHFSRWVYICASVSDIVLRLLWVLSLFPVSAFTEGAWNQAVFRAVLSAFELLRRSMWAILRIEHEQAAVGSGVLSVSVNTSNNSKQDKAKAGFVATAWEKV